jgi:predicted porin
MKKLLITVAVLGAFAGVASAQTSVTVYGVVDLNLSRDIRGGTNGAVTKLDSEPLNGSRLGFKGMEDLGGGLAAMFQIENGFSADTGAIQGSGLFGRQAWVGLRSGSSTVKLGRQLTPMYANSAVFDPFDDRLAGDSSRLFNYSVGTTGNISTSNVVSYGYDANGIRAQLQYGLGEVAGNSTAGRTIAGFGGYKNGPIDVVLTYTGNNDAITGVNGKTTLIGGNYDFNIVKVFAAYAWNKDVALTGLANTVTLGADTRDALIGLTAPVGALGTIRASYIRLTNKAQSNANATQIALGYTHDLSKRTQLYTSLSRTGNDSGVSYNAGANGATDKLFNLGVRHSF